MIAEHACCRAAAPLSCPEHYARELEPLDETIAELQSIVVAQRHRGDPHDVRDIEQFVGLLHAATELPDPAARTLHLIRLSMALAATAVRYREGIEP